MVNVVVVLLLPVVTSILSYTCMVHQGSVGHFDYSMLTLFIIGAAYVLMSRNLKNAYLVAILNGSSVACFSFVIYLASKQGFAMLQAPYRLIAVMAFSYGCVFNFLSLKHAIDEYKQSRMQ